MIAMIAAAKKRWRLTNFDALILKESDTGITVGPRKLKSSGLLIAPALVKMKKASSAAPAMLN
jgi:hypothetical protein